MNLPKDRILILDGAMGTMIQRYGLAENDYHGGPFSGCSKELSGNSECLNLTRPDIIKAIHKEYISAGADIIESNTFSANRISQSEYGCEGFAAQMAYEGARLAREVADETTALAASIGVSRKVWVAGSMGPTSKSLSLSPDASDPAFRSYSFDEMKASYKEQAEALIKGGVDVLLIETCFDALNVKAALSAIQECGDIPVMVSVSVGDRSGRTLTGQTLEAFYASISHYPILTFGLNCSLGATELTPLAEEISQWCSCGISCYPNAGLPNEMGGYDQSPADMAAAVKVMASKGLINVAGGCCGTSPDHIRAIAEALRGIAPREFHTSGNVLKVSGLEAVTVDVKRNNFTNVGERTNVAGSRKFARLISEAKYDEALQIAAKQIEDGATIIDINMDDAMLDSTREMERFVRYISNDPAVAKAALMIDSSHWETIIAGLKNAQGKCIVNSISLKEGPEAFVSKAKAIKELGAAMVIMAFDEQGQAVTYERKIEICERAYRLLTEEAGVAPEDIIFDVNILSVGTGIEEHARYAVDYIEAVRWIKANLPGALTSGGVSNLSFSFRGNNSVREAMHSAFLYHAIKAGLDMAIVNPSMLQVYDEIEPELLKCVEDVIFDTDPQATERLIEKASAIMAAKESAEKSPTSVKTEDLPLEERIKNALVKGTAKELEKDILEALNRYGSALAVIEGPLMAGMETVGGLFGEGKMFLPQVVKSAKIMRDAVSILEPHMENADHETSHPKVVLATVKGDVHDIGKNITGIVLSCNGFEVIDLGVMVDKDTILDKAQETEADIVAVSGLITPSLYQMEEVCREMTARGMKTPLLIGGATTSALHTAVKLAPLYDHVYYGPDASAAAVMAKKIMMDRESFEKEQKTEQEKIRGLYDKAEAAAEKKAEARTFKPILTSVTDIPVPADMKAAEIPAEKILPFFDWKMFYAIWGVKYGSSHPEAMELMQLRTDAEDELALGNYRIDVSARFFKANSDGKNIILEGGRKIPMLRQETGNMGSLADFMAPAGSGKASPLGVFTITVKAKKDAHEEGCCCPACSNKYEDMVAKAVRLTLAEAASKWMDEELRRQVKEDVKIIKPAAGYGSCPDHTLKHDILDLLSGEFSLGIKLTETCAMTPLASICGFIIMHPEAKYHEIRRISEKQYNEYIQRRGMDEQTARQFLGHLLK
ncbi:MAG: methionine synthase [Bacteroidales bacterium]|nr:methionine synthase [Bacteroidales bacterium]